MVALRHKRFDGIHAGVQTGAQALLGPLNVSLLGEAGHNRRAGLRASLRVTPRLTLHGGAGHARERPERRDYRNSRRSLDLGGSYDLPFGITAGIDASVSRTAFEPDWGFLTRGEPKRRDRLRSYRLTLHHRGWTLAGFAPRLSVSREVRKSNAQLQAYDRWHGELAFVRRF